MAGVTGTDVTANVTADEVTDVDGCVTGIVKADD